MRVCVGFEDENWPFVRRIYSDMEICVDEAIWKALLYSLR